MRTYFFGDIHGNDYALEACLKHLESLRVDQVLCLGDLAGWLPFGDRTVARMRSLEFPTVAGNHDLLVSGVFTDFPNQLDRMQASAFNAGLLTGVEGAIDYLSNLPLSIDQEDFVVVHHSPFDLPKAGEPITIKAFNYLDEPALAACLGAWQAYPKRLIISGHDHLPAVYELSDGVTSPLDFGKVRIHRPPPGASLTIELKPASRYWIKAGSVGGPYRDKVPVVNSVLYDSGAGTLTLHRFAYDTRGLHDELRSHFFACNLPTLKEFADLLEKGFHRGAIDL
jgi:predicted phosphodiesterase